MLLVLTIFLALLSLSIDPPFPIYVDLNYNLLLRSLYNLANSGLCFQEKSTKLHFSKNVTL